MGEEGPVGEVGVGAEEGVGNAWKSGTNVVIDIPDTPDPWCNERSARCSCCLNI